MNDADRFALLRGPYKTPRFRYGQVVVDEVRGQVVIVGMTDGRVPWPIGKGGRSRSLVVYKGLAKAVRRESNVAVQYWWGITGQTVTKWRRALDVPVRTEGTARLWRLHTREECAARGREKMWSMSRDAEVDKPRREKIAAAKRGKKRPAATVRKMRKAMLGKKLDEATRRKMSEAHRRRGTRPPAAGIPWTEAELNLLQELPAAEVVRQTGRSLVAIYSLRSKLKLPDGRRVKR